MNWGHKIALLYTGFVAMILTLVFMTSREKVDLVSPDYYEQEIKFQDKINAINNTQSLSAPVECEARNKSVRIKYPHELAENQIKGEVKLYRPSDSSLDYKTAISMNSAGEQVISSAKFKRGLYRMQLTWSMDNKDYCFEQQVFMN